jgi:hypothetical protein
MGKRRRPFSSLDLFSSLFSLFLHDFHRKIKNPQPNGFQLRVSSKYLM